MSTGQASGIAHPGRVTGCVVMRCLILGGGARVAWRSRTDMEIHLEECQQMGVVGS